MEVPRASVPRSRPPRAGGEITAAMLRAARSGDRRAEREVLDGSEPMVRGLAAHYASGLIGTGVEREDLEQHARLAVYRAVHQPRGFDDALGVPAGAFLRMCADRELQVVVQGARRRKHEILNRARHLDRPVGDNGLRLAELLPAPRRDAHDPGELLLVRERVDELAAVMRDLSTRERTVVSLLAGGRSYEEVHAIVGGGRRTVSNALGRARRKLAAAA